MNLLKKIGKYFLIFIGCLFLLFLGLIIAIQVPSVQNFAKNGLVSYLEKKIHTKVELQKIDIGFPNKLSLENLYLEGQKGDTLLYAQSMKVGLNMWQLLRNKADITSINFQDLKVNVVKNSEGFFNFQYIIDAFAVDEEESDSKPFIISLDRINLEKISVTYVDEQLKSQLSVFFNSLDTRVTDFDLEKNSYAIEYLQLDGLKLSVRQDILEGLTDEIVPKMEHTIDNNQSPFRLDLGKISLTNIAVDYSDLITNTHFTTKFKQLIVNPKQIDIEKNIYQLESIAFEDAIVIAELTNENSKANKIENSESLPIFLAISSLDTKNISVQYRNLSGNQSATNELNFDNLKIENFHSQVENIVYSSDDILAKVKNLSFKEHSGLQIDALKGDIKYGENETYIKNLFLQTPNTLVRDELVLNYHSKSDLTDNLENVSVKVNLDRSFIGFKDLLLISPQLRNQPPFTHYSDAKLYVNTTLRGNLQRLYIDHLELSGIEQTRIRARGWVSHILNPNQLDFDLKIQEFKSNASTVKKILPKDVFPSSISLPENFQIAGQVKGSLQNINAKLGLKSSFGDATLAALFDLRFANDEKYYLDAALHNFDMGKLIQNRQLGKITGTILAKGESLDFTKTQATLKAEIKRAEFNNYFYHDIGLDATIKQGNYTAHIESNDENALININASGIYSKENISLALDGIIEKINLKELRFSESTFSIAGQLDGAFTSLDPDALNGQLFLENFAISDGKEIYPIQDLSFFAISNEEANILQINSQIVDLQLSGKYLLTQISESLVQTINSYYQFTEQKTPDSHSIAEGQYFTIVGAIKDDDLIRKFIPDLHYFETINLVGNYQADQRKLTVNASAPLIEYETNKSENVLINLENNAESLQLVANIGGFSNNSFSLNEVNLGATVANNTLRFDLSVLDSNQELQYYFAALLDAQTEEKRLILDPNGLKLNYEDWMVSDDNYLAIASNGLYAHRILLQNNESEIYIDSEVKIPNSPLTITFKDFQIETITRIVQTDSLLANGVINGTAQLRDLQKNLAFTADVDVTQLKMYGNPLGTLSINAQSVEDNRIDIVVSLRENNNDVLVKGAYISTANAFDFDIDIQSLQMQSIQGFSMNQIRESRGYLSGIFKASGTPQQPKIVGKLKFNDVGMRLVAINSVFQNINDEIEFRPNGIFFHQFKINDEGNNALVLDGNILTETYRNFKFGLNIKGNDFKIVSSEKDESAILYGIMAVDADLNIRGDLNLPKIDGRIAVTDQTDFTFVLPQSSPALQERDGIIEFVDQDQLALLDTLEDEEEVVNKTIEGLDVNLNISVDKEAKISIVIDKTNGDFVKLQGEAELTGGIDPSGKMTLLGRYEVEDGAYEMSVNVLKRKFDIQEGSSITWTGEPTKADVDITAIYATKAAPLDLVEQQLQGRDAAYINMFKQRIPFYANLKMKGELLKPEISFDITTDKTNPSVDSEVTETVVNKLQELKTAESELNKQVFALLLLNRFVGENPFQSSAGLTAEGMARQSVSKLLSQQLNNLASDLIQGVEIDFDLDSTEDYTSGQKSNRTDLNIDVSKRLLNDRLKVSIGSNFGLEGQERQNENMTNIAGDIDIEYQLSKDGRYLLKAYRKDEYQVALQGQIIETGIGFIITLEYNKFKELLRRKRSYRNRNAQTLRNRHYQQPIIKEDEE